MFGIDLIISQNISSCIKSYKNGKMEKCIFVRIFKLTFISFSKLENLLESVIQKKNNFLYFMVTMENRKND